MHVRAPPPTQTDPANDVSAPQTFTNNSVFEEQLLAMHAGTMWVTNSVGGG
jgi:hypothetical protein